MIKTVKKQGQSEREYIRDLAKAYLEYAASPEMERRRALWSEHNALNFTTPPIYIRAIPFDEFFDPKTLQCTDPALRKLEHEFLLRQYHSTICDDYIEEPYWAVSAVLKTSPYAWGLRVGLGERPAEGGAAAYKPSIVEEEDLEKLWVAPHQVDEEATRERLEPLQELFDGILPVYVDRQGALCRMWTMDISTPLAYLRGLEQLMWDVYDRPEWLHRLLRFMQQKILQNMDETEAAGDFSFLDHQNQAMPYMKGLERPGCGKAKQSMLWGYMAAQEFTSFGPDMFKEFMFDYQKPILERYAVTAYGCCEDLTRKIDILRSLSNLRRIAVSPFADLKKCAEQIGGDYILSWRPSPSAMVARGVDEAYVRQYLRDGIDIMKQNGCKFDITLKDVETVAGDATAIPRWTAIVREEMERAY
ncbi:MAG: hypothetical protein PUC47_02450 [Oscillospiraceae bacterium]|nr:hypothetical protein [Oscillospiraceae bacterium]